MMLKDHANNIIKSTCGPNNIGSFETAAVYHICCLDDDLLERWMPFLFPATCRPKNLMHLSFYFLELILI